MNYRYLALLLLWMALIFYLSSIPSLGFGLEKTQEQVIRKSIHVIIFGILTFLMWVSISNLDKNLPKKIFLCAFLSTLFAITDEIHQAFVLGRCGNPKGVLFDVIGIVAALVCIHRFRRLHRLEAKALGEKTRGKGKE